MKEKKKKEYVYKTKFKRGRFFSTLAAILKVFKRRPEIINLSGGELADKAIYLSNHAGANGPLSYELFFPKLLTCWGTHEMFGNVRERRNYLYHVFYRQKLHWGKFRAFFVATVFAPISRGFYRSIGLIPTYTDSRFISSIKISCKILDENHPLLIFPEDSSRGYLNPPQGFNNGFVTMAKLYFKRRGEDVPVYPVYYLTKERKMVIAPPIYANAMLVGGKTADDVAAAALEACRKLYFENRKN